MRMAERNQAVIWFIRVSRLSTTYFGRVVSNSRTAQKSFWIFLIRKNEKQRLSLS
jgi:hypothetical protein